MLIDSFEQSRTPQARLTALVRNWTDTCVAPRYATAARWERFAPSSKRTAVQGPEQSQSEEKPLFPAGF